MPKLTIKELWSEWKEAKADRDTKNEEWQKSEEKFCEASKLLLQKIASDCGENDDFMELNKMFQISFF